ncbi:hypothetical protein TWF694_009974 [Orbilia ellipsospora]|uniref:Ketoreductase domain-containing protein n=1 Tax=Orbilia ellipsospora TaxID=2528407 RepID=A0AAV9XFM5_9PEZI
MLNLLGRCCLITGGSRGIGLAIATRFAQAGATCTLVARDEAQLRNAVSSLPAPNQQQEHDFLVGDVGDESFWELSVKTKPDIRILVNSAGQPQNSLLRKTTPEAIDHLVRVNLLGAIYGTKFYASEMSRRKEGCIINISSVLADTGGAGSAIYAASKAGLQGFTKSMVAEVSRFNIRINNILPGYIETDMTAAMDSTARSMVLSKIPLERFGTVEDIANAAHYLVTSRYVTGTNLVVDGGYSAS